MRLSTRKSVLRVLRMALCRSEFSAPQVWRHWDRKWLPSYGIILVIPLLAGPVAVACPSDHGSLQFTTLRLQETEGPVVRRPGPRFVHE